MNGLSICSGIGGIELGLKRLFGDHYKTICYIEREVCCASALVARMVQKMLDEAPVWDNLTTADCSPLRGLVDIIIAGYPCQPFSYSGKRAGTTDERHLWPFIYQIIKQLKPPYVFFENVSGHLTLGFDIVHSQLQELGYHVEAGLFTAEEIGAPHKRERLFILGYSAEFGRRQRQEQQWQESTEGCAELGYVDSSRLSAGWKQQQGNQLPAFPPGPSDSNAWARILEYAPEVEPAVCRVVDGFPSGMDDYSWADQLRGLGNAVVPVVAGYAFANLLQRMIS